MKIEDAILGLEKIYMNTVSDTVLRREDLHRCYIQLLNLLAFIDHTKTHFSLVANTRGRYEIYYKGRCIGDVEINEDTTEIMEWIENGK